MPLPAWQSGRSALVVIFPWQSAVCSVLQPGNLALDVPDCFAEVLDGIALFPTANKVLESISNAKILVFAETDCLNSARMRRVVCWMVDGIVHARTLPKPAWLSTASFRPTPQVPLFQKVNMAPLQALPAHHSAPVRGNYSPAGTSPRSKSSASSSRRRRKPLTSGQSRFISRN